MTKTSEITRRITSPSPGDRVVILDVSDTTDGAGGSSGYATVSDLLTGANIAAGGMLGRGLLVLPLPPQPVKVAGPAAPTLELIDLGDGTWNFGQDVSSSTQSAARIATVGADADFTAYMAIRLTANANASSHTGLYCKGSGGIRTFGPRFDNTMFWANWSTAYGFVANGTSSPPLVPSPIWYLRARRAGDQLFFHYSWDGTRWIGLTTLSVAATTVTITELGISLDWDGSATILGWLVN